MSAPTVGRPRPEPSAEHARLAEAPDDSDAWRMWGPYLAGRQWGTVREDYSPGGDAWEAFPFDHAHRRAYRWGEDGIGGLCDRFGFLNLGVALWNGHDDRLKERLFGLGNPEGNHGEDVKEYWWHLDATPTHSFAQMVYRYPQAAFPYDQLRREGSLAARPRTEGEYELSDTGVLDDDRFFDVVVTHAKATPTDIVVTITATNHGPDPAPLHLVPQLWFRNTWAWGRDDRTPSLRSLGWPGVDDHTVVAVQADHGQLGRYVLFAEGAPDLMMCDNETDSEGLWGVPNRSPHPKDAVDRAVVHGDASALATDGTGTKAAFRYRFDAVAPGDSVTVRLRLMAAPTPDAPFATAASVVRDRQADADAFYAVVIPAGVPDVDRHTARRAFAGMLWGKQLYRYDVEEWLEGDPASPPPPDSRLAPSGRNSAWRHLAMADVISMPDEWEYPWFATWDLAFHAVTLSHIDPAFAKAQLLLLCREWSQHPNGQLPAYEWAFSDVNPPVHAWAAWQVYLRDGAWDLDFLKRVLTKLLLNVSWWVNRKDADGSDLFEGGFLGMDNIGVFDRSKEVPAGWRLEQSDATAWMAFMCLSMMRIAQELGRHDHAFDDLATTFLERFLAICRAMRAFGSQGVSLWDETDGFFYDALVGPHGEVETMRVRSLVGLLPLLAVGTCPAWVLDELPDFAAALRWLERHRPDEVASLATTHPARGDDLTFAVVDPTRATRLLERLLDEREFLSPHGIRSLSAAHRDGVTVDVAGMSMSLRYTPGESDTGLFGGNSNWRGPVWMPLNLLLVDALHTYAAGSGATTTVEFPTGSGERVGLHEAARRLEDRLVGLFRPGPDGRRPSDPRDLRDLRGGPLWTKHPTFSEYFHGDSGVGLGASHQTGWTAMVAHLICTPQQAYDPGRADPPAG